MRYAKVAVAIAMALALCAFVSTYQAKKAVIAYVPAQVGAGGTVWRLCERAKVANHDSRDIREIVYETIVLNRLPQGGLVGPGQVIIIPVQPEGGNNE